VRAETDFFAKKNPPGIFWVSPISNYRGETAKSLPECKTESHTFLVQMLEHLYDIDQYQKGVGRVARVYW
jgi:hypothetical protein